MTEVLTNKMRWLKFCGSGLDKTVNKYADFLISWIIKCRAWFSILWLNSTGWIKSPNRKYCAQHGISASGVECLIEGLIHFSHKKLFRYHFFINLVSGKSFLFSVVFIESLGFLSPACRNTQTVVRNIRSAVSKRNFGLKNQNFDLNLNF